MLFRKQCSRYTVLAYLVCTQMIPPFPCSVVSRIRSKASNVSPENDNRVTGVPGLSIYISHSSLFNDENSKSYNT